MEIKATVKYKHGTICRILNDNGISLKSFSKICGWKYTNLQRFVSLKVIPIYEDRESLFNELLKLDSSIKYEDIFPEYFSLIKEKFKNESIIRRIPNENIIELKNDTVLIDSCNFEREDSIKEIKKFLRYYIKSYKKSDFWYRVKIILRIKCFIRYNGLFGFGYETLEQIGRRYNITREMVRTHKNNVERDILKSRGIFDKNVINY